MDAIDHRARLCRQRAVVLEDVETALPPHVQRRGLAPYAHEDVAGRKTRARGLELAAHVAKHAVDARGFLGTADDGLAAREVLDAPGLRADAQQVRGQVDVGHVLADELFEVRIGDVHGCSRLVVSWRQWYHAQNNDVR